MSPAPRHSDQPSPRIALVLGGARSGKSALAERLVAQWADGSTITYVATAVDDGTDAALSGRVARHVERRERSSQPWAVVDARVDIAAQLRALRGPVLLDSLGPWVAQTWDRHAADTPAQLVAALTARDGDTVVVSDEVGLSIHPPSEAGRWFVDRVGEFNAAIATVSEPVWFCSAGRAVPLVTPEVLFGDVE